ncbi:MAG: hypothetical protein HPY58_05275 [Firmicutes bacterium]|nr:hypothetical protein [Bacillota bacterium]
MLSPDAVAFAEFFCPLLPAGPVLEPHPAVSKNRKTVAAASNFLPNIKNSTFPQYHHILRHSEK